MGLRDHASLTQYEILLFCVCVRVCVCVWGGGVQANVGVPPHD